MKYTIVNHRSEERIYVPKSVTECKYCGGQVYIIPHEIDETTDDEEHAGLCVAVDLKVECKSTDRMSAKRYLETHTDMPYVNWLPVCQDALEWFNQHYRIDDTDWVEKMRRWRVSCGLPPEY